MFPLVLPHGNQVDGDAEFVGDSPRMRAVEHFGLPVFVLGDEEVGGEPVCPGFLSWGAVAEVAVDGVAEFVGEDTVFLWCAHAVSQADLFAVVVVPAWLACPVVGDVHT